MRIERWSTQGTGDKDGRRAKGKKGKSIWKGEKCRYGLHNRSCARERDVKKKGRGERIVPREQDRLMWEFSKHVRRGCLNARLGIVCSLVEEVRE
jgi:hypothetical protein